MADMARGLGGLSRMGGSPKAINKMGGTPAGKNDPLKHEKGVNGGMENDRGEDAQTHQIHDHGDGSFTTVNHKGEETEHPDHLHMLAHIGHEVTGGDKHHVTHHDGMEMHSHSIHESGEHEETLHHNSPEEAGVACKACMADDPQGVKDDVEEERAENEEPHYGAMRG